MQAEFCVPSAIRGYSLIRKRLICILRARQDVSRFYQDGVSTGYNEEEATKILSEPEVTVLVDMKMGEESATAWGCDLTYDYVKINADYRS